MILLAAARESAVRHAEKGYPQEACGLLIGRVDPDGVRVTRALPCPNVAEPSERERRFAIDPRVVLNVRRSLRGSSESIVGFFHSHPDHTAEPSALDREHIALWPETLWMIVPVAGGAPAEARVWWLDQSEDAEIRELPVRVVTPRVPALAGCPE